LATVEKHVCGEQKKPASVEKLPAITEPTMQKGSSFLWGKKKLNGGRGGKIQKERWLVKKTSKNLTEDMGRRKGTAKT